MIFEKTSLRVGDWVEVRTTEEILRTLDADGRLEGMPFMPEMFAFCGKQFQVYKSAHKTCDTVFPVRGRRVSNAVHLQTRCDGSFHGGCDAGCLLFWKLDWLKPISKHKDAATSPVALSGAAISEKDLQARTQTTDPQSGLPKYVCQATQLPYATSNLEWWELRQYIEDYVSGNVGIGRIISGAIYMAMYRLTRAGIGAGRPIRWCYDKFHSLWRGSPFPRRSGTVPDGVTTPVATLNLKAGELVRIKPYNEILSTLNESNRNRGLYFDAEEVPYCGKTYRVLKRVERIINERTGVIQEMKTPCVILDSVICESRYSECRMFCPRSIYPYWREIWLERVGREDRSAAEEEPGQGETARAEEPISLTATRGLGEETNESAIG
ncbi:MAG TPA: hypothetical protein VMB19_09310 [Silvibacterium sp.]|nr:hypothetical protein [Silvibacterium sp.]